MSGLLICKGKCLQISVEYREVERLYSHIYSGIMRLKFYLTLLLYNICCTIILYAATMPIDNCWYLTDAMNTLKAKEKLSLF